MSAVENELSKEDVTMRLYVGVTNANWYNFLAARQPDEVNFWQPGGRQVFKALESGDLFLFKLHSPLKYVDGGGFFVHHIFLPVSLAWETFGDKNGTVDYHSFSNAIYRYRRSNKKDESDPVIGCIILTEPFFFDRSEWVPVPEDWKPSIVQGKSYDADTFVGRRLYQQVQERLNRLSPRNNVGVEVCEDDLSNRYGAKQNVHPRIGQGAFKILVTEAYHRRCAISGEKTLPVLEAAHIKPYSQEGPHATSNGLLLRKDIHVLFDRGYITIDQDLHIEVSKKIKEVYGNGKEYYAFHGKQLVEIPNSFAERPAKEFLEWHNENVFMPENIPDDFQEGQSLCAVW